MNEKILIPENWSEINLGKFQELQKLDKKSENYDSESIAIICDMDVMDAMRLDIQVYAKILSSLSWLSNMPTVIDYKPILEVNNKKYGLVKMSSFTNGQWYSLETWLENPAENLHKIMALIYRPLIVAVNDDVRIVEDYSTITAPERAKLFKSLPIADCYGALLFFSITEKQSMRTMKEYLELKIVMTRIMPKRLVNWMTRRTMTRWLKGGRIGIPFFTTWQKAISRKLKQS